jgi:hypothetical protein
MLSKRWRTFVPARALGALADVAVERPLHRGEQLLLGSALLQEILGAAAHRPDRRDRVRVAGEEEHGGGADRRASSACRSSPPNSGICRSTTTQPGKSSPRWARKSTAET